MTDSVLVQDWDNATVWAHAADFSSTNNGLTDTHELDLTSLADGACRQGTKADLGATMAARYSCYCCFEPNAAPTSNEMIHVYWYSSSDDGLGYASNVSGTDGLYTGTAGDSLDDSLMQMLHIATLICTNDALPQYVMNPLLHADEIGRYGVPFVYNDCGQALNTADANEMFVALVPWVDQLS